MSKNSKQQNKGKVDISDDIKENKKKNKKAFKKKEENVVLKKILIAVVFFICIFGFFLLVTMRITEGNKDVTSSEVTVQFQEILLGSSFNRNDKSYLILYFDKSDDQLYENFNIVGQEYNSKEEKLPFYTVDMSVSFNKKYATTEETNKNPQSIDDLLINGPTLIKFTNGKVVDYIEGGTEITEYLS